MGNPVCDALAAARSHRPGVEISGLSARYFGGSCTDAIVSFADGTRFTRFTPLDLPCFNRYAARCGFPSPPNLGLAWDPVGRRLPLR